MRCTPSEAAPLPLLHADESLLVPRAARGDVDSTVAPVDTELVNTIFEEEADPCAEGDAACGEPANTSGTPDVRVERGVKQRGPKCFGWSAVSVRREGRCTMSTTRGGSDPGLVLHTHPGSRMPISHISSVLRSGTLSPSRRYRTALSNKLVFAPPLLVLPSPLPFFCLSKAEERVALLLLDAEVLLPLLVALEVCKGGEETADGGRSTESDLERSPFAGDWRKRGSLDVIVGDKIKFGTEAGQGRRWAAAGGGLVGVVDADVS
ncbi:hypothetical protein C8R45DRAFT_1112365 [Mycena sanguinolenta]|nr:hypothetical protein C8R45DRAFT_1112365 [Mycena sanguinolenta]